jgi:hypothetical protein
MTKNVGLTYVKDFTFPKEQGFTGSAASGTHQVRGYQRGGRVKKMGEGGYYGKPGDKYPKLKSGPTGKRSAMPRGVKAKGGAVKKQMGGYMGPEREIAVDDVKITVPKNRGGYMKGGIHDKLKHEGAKMGYAYGGQVKDTSAEFKQTRGKQDTMDHGVQPAQKGRNQAEVEAGGNKRLKAGYMKGGGVHRVRGQVSSREANALRRASKKGMPKNVKAQGGLAKYAHGGKARKPYTGYNKQPGGSGNEDKRYMS